jgi:hypothetical protein
LDLSILSLIFVTYLKGTTAISHTTQNNTKPKIMKYLEFIKELDDNNEKMEKIANMIAFALNDKNAEFEIDEMENGDINFNFTFGGNSLVYYNYRIDNYANILLVMFENSYSQRTGKTKKGTMTNINFEVRLLEKLDKKNRPFINFGRWVEKEMNTIKN